MGAFNLDAMAQMLRGGMGSGGGGWTRPNMQPQMPVETPMGGMGMGPASGGFVGPMIGAGPGMGMTPPPTNPNPMNRNPRMGGMPGLMQNIGRKMQQRGNRMGPQQSPEVVQKAKKSFGLF